MWMLAVVGCVYVEREVWDSGDDSGDSTEWTWDTTTPGPDTPCTSDEQCPGNYACNGGVTVLTDAHGCVERCTADSDCKAGSNCQGDGSCG